MSNAIYLIPEEIPSLPDVTYLLHPAPATSASGREGTNEPVVVFCMDISKNKIVSFTNYF